MSARDVLKLCTLTFLPCAFVVFSPKETFLVLFFISYKKLIGKQSQAMGENHFENLRDSNAKII